jgi:serine/threonine-protein kinase
MSTLQLQKVLGSGAFGTVYLGLLQTGKTSTYVAVKVMSKEGASSDRFLKRLRDEATLLTLLDTSLIIKVLGSCSIRGLDAVILEYVDGVDMHKLYCSSIQVPAHIIAVLGARVAEGLHMAHTAIHPQTKTPLSVIHRDIKPGNIMLTKNGEVKLCDFGIAKAVFETRESYTSPQEILGTKDYIAPEYVIQGRITTAADVYAMGLSLLQLLLKGSIGELKLTQREHEQRIQILIRRLPTQYKTISPVLAQILSWDPSQRPSALQCAQQFQTIAQKIPSISFAQWSQKWISELLKQLPPPKDKLQLLGVTVTLDEQQRFSIRGQETQQKEFSAPDPIPPQYIYIALGVFAGVFSYALIFSFLFSLASQ